MRRSASSSRASSHAQNGQNGKKSAAPDSASNYSDPHADESPENHRDRDRDREDDERGRHGWGAGEEPIAPHLAKAITARWFAADLGNTTAAAAVYDEVSPAVPRKRFRCLAICSSIGGIIAAVGGVQERTCAPYSTVLPYFVPYFNTGRGATCLVLLAQYRFLVSRLYLPCTYIPVFAAFSVHAPMRTYMLPPLPAPTLRLLLSSRACEFSTPTILIYTRLLPLPPRGLFLKRRCTD